MMLNITNPSDQGISFARGEILTGTVQEIKNDGLLVMMLKGRLVKAASEVMVRPGQQLFLQVDDFRDGRTFLKVITPEHMKTLENMNIAANLQSMGITAQEDRVIMARKLLQHNLPVTPQNLNEMAKGIKLLGAANQRNLEVVAFALSRNLPINQQVLSALLQFTDAKTDLSRLFKMLNQSVEQISRLAADAPSSPVPPPSISLPWLGEETAANNVTVSNISALPGKEQGISRISQPISREALKYLDILRSLLEVLQVPADEKPAYVAAKIQSLLQSENELIRGLVILEEVLRNGDSKSQLSLLTELLGQVENLEKEISGQRLFNYISRLPDSNLNYFYFSFPVKLNDDYHLCQLRINREAGNKDLKNQEEIKLVVSLDTAKMGIVLFHVSWNRNKTLTLQGVVEAQAVMDYLSHNLDHLVTSLNQLGYKVTNLGIRLTQQGERLDNLKPQMQTIPMPFRPLSIDIKV